MDTGEDEYPYNQNLGNAQRWAKGERCRSWHEMKRNLMQSFAAMETCSLPEHRRHVSRKQKYIMGRVWFIARFTTEVCKDIEKQYGEEFLVECIEYFKQETIGHKLDGMRIEREVAKLRSIIRPTTTKQVNAAWRIVTKKHWEAEAGRQAGEMTDSVKKYMTTYTKKYGNRALLLPQHIKELRELYGPPINFWINAYNFRGVPQPTNSYFQCFNDVNKLVKQDGITLAQVEQYGQRLMDEGLSATLQWSYHWLNSRYHDEAGRYKEAFDAMTIAFKQAKYVAGNQQESLIHQYIHLSAKVNNWVGFKNGVAWALYMGLPVRMISRENYNIEELRAAFELYKTASFHTFNISRILENMDDELLQSIKAYEKYMLNEQMRINNILRKQ